MTSEIYELIFRGLKAKYPGQAIGPHFQAVCAALDGGKGSGNFGHEGRPGKVGGSGEGGGKESSSQKSPAQTQEQTFSQLKESVPAEVREKMEKVNIDFSKDNILPAINPEDAAELGVEAKPVRLKKTIIDRQEAKHPETKEKANVLVASALYAPDIKIPGKKAGYMHFIKQLSDDNHSLVLLDLQESPEGYFDVVHYFGIDNKNKKRIVKNTNKKTSTEGR